MFSSDDKKIYRVFLASTWDDFRKEREQVLEALRHFYFQHVNMEYFGADPRKPIEKCLDEVRTSDVFVGIIGHRYGTILEDTGKSYTHMEYEEAAKIGLPCLIYFRSDDVPILPKFVERNQDSIKKLEEFKMVLLKNHTVYYFNYSDNLVARVTSDLSSLVQTIKAEKTYYANVDALSTKIITVIESYLSATQERDKLLNSVMRHYGFYTEDDYSRTVDKIKKVSVGIARTLAMMVETRDPYTIGYQERVAKFAASIAQESDLSDEQIEGIQLAGMIHNIGMISVPSEILNKPKQLSEFEFKLIKEHPQTGYSILKDIEFPWPIARMVLEHHERMNGAGYPQGLAGDNILAESRILAVSDVIAAITSHRPYRPALGIDVALEEISQNKGILYDPEVVDVCLRLFKKKGFGFN